MRHATHWKTTVPRLDEAPTPGKATPRDPDRGSPPAAAPDRARGLIRIKRRVGPHAMIRSEFRGEDAA